MHDSSQVLFCACASSYSANHDTFIVSNTIKFMYDYNSSNFNDVSLVLSVSLSLFFYVPGCPSMIVSQSNKET